MNRLIAIFFLIPCFTSACGESIDKFVTVGLADFHSRSIERMKMLELNSVLARKNPFLFRAKNPDSSKEFIASLLEAHVSSQEETFFGTFLEQTAIHVCSEQRSGRKSAIEGIDLEFEDKESKTKYIIAIKSGPNSNSDQIKKMRDHFLQARRVLRTNTNSGFKLVAVHGCCYSKTSREDKGDHVKLCGQRFWELVSGEEDYYLKLMSAIGKAAQKQKAGFAIEYEKTLARFNSEFSKEFCDADGTILWDKLLRYNSQHDE
jgi:hypothetical protein